MFIVFYISIYKANVYYIYKPQQNQEFPFGERKKVWGLENYLVRKYISVPYEEKKDMGFLYGLFSFKFMALLFFLLITLKVTILNQEKSSIICIL